MKVWLVGVKNAEGFDIEHACLSEDTAFKRWKEIRGDLIRVCLHHIERAKTKSYDGELKMYERQLKNLFVTNPKTMNNYPHDEPSIMEMETEE